MVLCIANYLLSFHMFKEESMSIVKIIEGTQEKWEKWENK